MKAYLQYVGSGSLAGVPARNLSKEEAQAHGVKRLIDSGLYRLANSVPLKPKSKLSLGGSENKAKE